MVGSLARGVLCWALLFPLTGCGPGADPDLGPRDTGPAPPPDRGPDDGLFAPASDPDGDTILNRDEDAPNRDTDGDGTPDHLDLDSDADTILDRDEARDDDPRTPPPDSDGDGSPDVIDLDADGDGWSDAEEAGDADLDTRPVDTDDDGLPDYLDLDSDSDGLRDDVERELGANPRRVDSDDDGFSDLIEVTAGTDPADPRDTPNNRLRPVELTFVVPLREEPMPATHVVEMRTAPRQVDLYLLLDVSGSMADAAEELAVQLRARADGLRCARSERLCAGDLGCSDGEVCSIDGQCIEDPGAHDCWEDLRVGLGTFAGAADSYRHEVSPGEDPEVVADAIAAAAGLDGEESLFAAAACVADPTACFGALCDEAADRVGCGGLRRDATRVLAVVTDAANGCPGSGEGACLTVNTAGEAGRRMQRASIEVLGIDLSGDSAAADDLRALGLAAGSLDEAGAPHVRSATAATVLGELESGLRDVLAAQTDPVLDAEVVDRAGDEVDVLQFVQGVTLDATAPGCSGRDEMGCWVVTARANTRVTGLADRHRVVVADLIAFADGARVDRRPLYFVVPQAD